MDETEQLKKRANEARAEIEKVLKLYESADGHTFMGEAGETRREVCDVRLELASRPPHAARGLRAGETRSCRATRGGGGASSPGGDHRTAKAVGAPSPRGEPDPKEDGASYVVYGRRDCLRGCRSGDAGVDRVASPSQVIARVSRIVLAAESAGGSTRRRWHTSRSGPECVCSAPSTRRLLAEQLGMLLHCLREHIGGLLVLGRELHAERSVEHG